MRITACLLAFAAVAAAAPPLFNSTSDTDWKKWSALRGNAQVDAAVVHENRPALRLDRLPMEMPTCAPRPVSLRHRQALRVQRMGAHGGPHRCATSTAPRSPPAPPSRMASMPFDVHSESLAGTRDGPTSKLRFIATRSQDQIAAERRHRRRVHGKAWFEGVSLDEISAGGGMARARRRQDVRSRLSLSRRPVGSICTSKASPTNAAISTAT